MNDSPCPSCLEASARLAMLQAQFDHLAIVAARFRAAQVAYSNSGARRPSLNVLMDARRDLDEALSIHSERLASEIAVRR